MLTEVSQCPIQHPSQGPSVHPYVCHWNEKCIILAQPSFLLKNIKSSNVTLIFDLRVCHDLDPRSIVQVQGQFKKKIRMVISNQSE